MSWQVSIKKQVLKQLSVMPENIQKTTRTLVIEIEKLGPLRHNWPNYGKLQGKNNLYHCHIKNGKPTYVACWEVKDKTIKIIEVYYVGTHEKAPY